MLLKFVFLHLENRDYLPNIYIFQRQAVNRKMKIIPRKCLDFLFFASHKRTNLNLDCFGLCQTGQTDRRRPVTSRQVCAYSRGH